MNVPGFFNEDLWLGKPDIAGTWCFPYVFTLVISTHLRCSLVPAYCKRMIPLFGLKNGSLIYVVYMNIVYVMKTFLTYSHIEDCHSIVGLMMFFSLKCLLRR